MSWGEIAKIEHELTFGKGTVTPKVIEEIIATLERMQKDIKDIQNTLPTNYED